jgi:dTDP-4-amino-4,6-dideoxygalactose transaminase
MTVSNPSTSKSAPAVGAPVPMLDLRRQYASIREETQEAIARVCESQQLILGEEAAAFERETSSFLGVKETIACASGTDALWLMMQAAGVGPGDCVITTPFSFFASASAIVRTGARPVFADIEPDTLNLNPTNVAELLEDSDFRIKGILPVHLYGQCANMDRFADLASEHKVMLFEDAAQAFGAAWRGKRAGGLGLASAFSFYPTKNLSAFGDAGCVTTNDGAIATRVRSLRNHGSTQRYYHDEFGWNARMDAIQAAVLRVKLKHLPQWNAKRREIAERYDELFFGAGLSDSRVHAKPDSPKPVRLLATLPENAHIFHQYVIRVEKRDQLRKFLSDRAIGSEIYYPVSLHLQKTFTYLGHIEGDLPEAERAEKEVLALPIFPELTEDEQKRVVASIAEFYS